MTSAGNKNKNKSKTEKSKLTPSMKHFSFIFQSNGKVEHYRSGNTRQTKLYYS